MQIVTACAALLCPNVLRCFIANSQLHWLLQVDTKGTDQFSGCQTEQNPCNNRIGLTYDLLIPGNRAGWQLEPGKGQVIHVRKEVAIAAQSS